jgi:hypothetical protein
MSASRVVGLGGRTTGAGRRRVGARDAPIGHVLGPFRSRPVPVFVPARWVDKPTGRDSGEGDLARCRVDGIGCLTAGCGVGERVRRGWDPGLPRPAPLPAAPRREYPHHEERDEDDDKKPGTVTVIERHLRLLGPVIWAGVTSDRRTLTLARGPWSDHPRGRGRGIHSGRGLGTVSRSAVSCRRIVGPGYERPYGSSDALGRIAGGAVPAYHGGAPLILTLERSSWTKN